MSLPHTTGSGVAALSRELSRLYTEISTAMPRTADPLDELWAHRRQRLAEGTRLGAIFNRRKHFLTGGGHSWQSRLSRHREAGDHRGRLLEHRQGPLYEGDSPDLSSRPLTALSRPVSQTDHS